MRKIHSDKAPKAIGPYAQAIVAGDFVFCSGQTPLDPKTMQLVGEDIVPQTRQVLSNLSVILGNEGLGLKDVVKVTVFLKNFADFE